ncbi:MAG: DUF3124 domain-containing protein [Candidatus Obscuribacterales bacterium]|nr:DUF3124 domain-containing protein [Candidatus Obscuribacterales bacterium]
MKETEQRNYRKLPELFLWLAAALFIVGAALALTACHQDKVIGEANIENTAVDRPETWQTHLKAASLKPGERLHKREVIYLPVYSHIYSHDHVSLKIDLAETVSIRNTDFGNPIILTSVKHYRTDGKLVKEYIRAPLKIDPMATADFVVPRNDSSGGSGANFIIEWVSRQKVNRPIAEAIMIFAASSHSISFLSRGEVIESTESPLVTAEECQKWQEAESAKEGKDDDSRNR